MLIISSDQPVEALPHMFPAPSLLVLDPKPLHRATLRSLLEGPPIRATVEPAATIEECADLLARSPFDLVVAAIRPELTPRRVLRTVAVARAGVPVLFLAESADLQGRIDALRAGATGTLTRDTTPDEFVAAIQASLRGRRSIDEALADLLLSAPSIDRSLEQAALSNTEREILGLLGDAWSTRAIADARGISPKSVRNHLTNIYRKLGVSSRPEAARYAARMGTGLAGDQGHRP